MARERSASGTLPLTTSPAPSSAPSASASHTQPNGAAQIWVFFFYFLSKMKDDEDEDESLVATVLVLATVIWATILAFLFVTGKLTKEKINSSSDIDWENHPHRKKLLWTPPIIAILLLLPATAKFLGFSEKHYVCDVANPEEKRHKRICSNKSFLTCTSTSGFSYLSRRCLL